MSKFVDLDKWKPGEDVDDDALILEEVRRYRKLIAHKAVKPVSSEGWTKFWDALKQFEPDDIPDCPDCVQGKHMNCHGFSWNNTLDKEVYCPCASKDHRLD